MFRARRSLRLAGVASIGATVMLHLMLYPPAYGYYVPAYPYAYYPPARGYYVPVPPNGDYPLADGDYADYPAAEGDYPAPDGDYADGPPPGALNRERQTTRFRIRG